MDLKKIAEGFRNQFMPPAELKDLIHQVQEERLSRCLNCRFNTTPGRIENLSKCDGCGCFLKTKTACLSCDCGATVHNERNPNNIAEVKWYAVTDEEIENQVKDKIK